MRIQFLLFDGFETLDLFGPVEILNRLPEAAPHYLSVSGGGVVSAQQTRIHTERLEVKGGILLVPGGRGTRPQPFSGRNRPSCTTDTTSCPFRSKICPRARPRAPWAIGDSCW